MAFVEGGSFQMGSNDGYGDEKPIHEVTFLRSGLENEVTQRNGMK